MSVREHICMRMCLCTRMCLLTYSIYVQVCTYMYISWKGMNVVAHAQLPFQIWSSKLKCRAVSRLAPSQWETPLQSNAVSHWLGANLESALMCMYVFMCMSWFTWCRIRASPFEIECVSFYSHKITHTADIMCYIETTLTMNVSFHHLIVSYLISKACGRSIRQGLHVWYQDGSGGILPSILCESLWDVGETELQPTRTSSVWMGKRARHHIRRRVAINIIAGRNWNPRAAMMHRQHWKRTVGMMPIFSSLATRDWYNNKRCR